MKSRILYGWSFRRLLYLAMGVIVIVYAVEIREWWGILIGAYFGAMGLFNFGCAAGSCSYEPKKRTGRPSDESVSDFEEIKTK